MEKVCHSTETSRTERLLGYLSVAAAEADLRGDDAFRRSIDRLAHPSVCTSPPTNPTRKLLRSMARWVIKRDADNTERVIIMARMELIYERPALLLQALNGRRWEEAEAQLRDIIKRQKLHPEMLLDLGRVLNAQGKWDDAAKTLKRALRKWPDNPMVRNELGTAAINLRDWPVAIEQFSKLYALAPQEPEIMLNYATCLVEAQEPDKATVLFAELKQHPKLDTRRQVYAWVLLIEALRDAKKVDAMRDEIAALTTRHPETRQAVLNILTKGVAGRVPLVAARLQSASSSSA
ncbi:MAG: tetratricopeptide repeat protein [Pseudomonadota bacterium]